MTQRDAREFTLHPGRHEFTSVCRLCGAEGMLHVSIITPHERVTITDSRSSASDVDFGEGAPNLDDERSLGDEPNQKTGDAEYDTLRDWWDGLSYKQQWEAYVAANYELRLDR